MSRFGEPGFSWARNAEAPQLALEVILGWAQANGWVLMKRETCAAFAKAARVEVEFVDGGVVVVGPEKEAAK